MRHDSYAESDYQRPSDLERLDDETYANDYATIVECLLIARDRMATREKFHAWICQLLNRGPMLAVDQPLDQFRFDYGDSALYRAAAKALELHAQNGKAA